VGAGLACLPNDEVWFHHWIVGTPFLYVAIALLLAGPGEPARATDTRRRALGVVVGVLLVNRLVVMGLLVGWLADGRASRGFDPELDRLGRFAARQGDDVTFVAATWGIATQVFCWSNAREGVVSEPFWSYTGPEQLQPVLQGRRAFYLLSTVPLSDVTPESSRRILRDATTLADWTQAPVDAELAGLRTVLVTKHVRSAEGPPPLR
jgi:hypothetical protein